MLIHGRCENNKVPLSLAENLCVPCVNEVAQERNIKTSARKVARAWHLVELAHASRKPMVKQKSLEDSSKLLDRALAQKSSVSGHAKARMLQSFLPSFSDRVNGMDPSDASRRYTNKSLGELLLWRYESRVADNAGWSSEALVFYLMSREGIPSEDLLFIGSPREETNVAHARLNHEHIGSGLTDQAIRRSSLFKLRLRVKTPPSMMCLRWL